MFRAAELLFSPRKISELFRLNFPRRRRRHLSVSRRFSSVVSLVVSRSFSDVLLLRRRRKSFGHRSVMEQLFSESFSSYSYLPRHLRKSLDQIFSELPRETDKRCTNVTQKKSTNS